MLTAGQILDMRYKIDRKIGGGGFGAVYIAEDIRFTGKNRIAIKEIIPRTDTEAKALRREANLLYNLNHPNLPKVSNCFMENGAYLIVMDYISGEDLAERLVREKQIEPAEVLEIADKVLDALEYLHSFPIYHRDVKPHNIKIDENGKIFLLDFGAAKGDLDEDALTRTGQSITGFTPFYAPIEQVLRADANSYLILQAEHPNDLERCMCYRTDEKSDIYSLASTLFNLISGTVSYTSSSVMRARAIWSKQPDPLPLLSTINNQVPEQLALVLQKAMAIEPQHRYQTAREFRDALKKSVEKTPDDLYTGETIPSDAGFEGQGGDGKAEILPDDISEAETEPVSRDTGGEKTEILPDWQGDALSVETLDQKAFAGRGISGSEKATEILDISDESGGVAEKTQLLHGEGKRSKKGFLWTGILAVIVLGVMGYGAWRMTRVPVVSGVSDGTNNNSVVKTVATPTYSLEYSVRRKESKGDGVKSTGQEMFSAGDQFQASISPPSGAGFLYLFNAGPAKNNKTVFSILYPTPKKNRGSASVNSGEQIQTGWNKFDGKPEAETIWIIWTRNRSDDLERIKKNAFKHPVGRITNKYLEQTLYNYIQSNIGKEIKRSDLFFGGTKLEFNGDSFVCLLPLIQYKIIS